MTLLQDLNRRVEVIYEESDALLGTMLEYFRLDSKVITDIHSEMKTKLGGGTYEELTFHTHFTDETGATVSQPMQVLFDTDGNMTGMRVENVDKKGVDIFSFSNFGVDSAFNNMEEVFRIAKENIIAVEDVHPSKLLEPTLDEQRMKEWGIQYRVDDDLLTQYGSEVWFCHADGYDMTVHTNSEYWLEKQTDAVWEKLEMIAVLPTRRLVSISIGLIPATTKHLLSGLTQTEELPRWKA